MTHYQFAPDLLWPAGQIWLPSAELSACLWAGMERDTLGHALQDAQRLNHFPATPLCALTWVLQGQTYPLGWEDQLPAPSPGSEPVLDTGAWVLAGPQTRPRSSWNPAAVCTLSLLIVPDALEAMTGLDLAALTDQTVDAHTHLPAEWQALYQAVAKAADAASRQAATEAFFRPLWRASRESGVLGSHRVSDWVQHLAMRAATSATGRSLRQFERRVKRWTGLALRDLQGLGRSERVFFHAVEAHLRGEVDWAQLALEAGYADQAHFCRVTRRITGLSPEALREGILNEEAFWPYRLWLNPEFPDAQTRLAARPG